MIDNADENFKAHLKAYTNPDSDPDTAIKGMLDNLAGITQEETFEVARKLIKNFDPMDENTENAKKIVEGLRENKGLCNHIAKIVNRRTGKLNGRAKDDMLGVSADAERQDINRWAAYLNWAGYRPEQN